MEEDIPGIRTYAALLTSIKERIQKAQVRAALAVNRELVLLYWGIGNEILARQQEEGWGTKVVERLARDLRFAFPEMKGFSRTNLLYMRLFSEAWPQEAIVQQLAGQLPWFHNCIILDKIKDRTERVWYIQAAIENGWSRNVLVMQIEAGLHARQGKALTNFSGPCQLLSQTSLNSCSKIPATSTSLLSQKMPKSEKSRPVWSGIYRSSWSSWALGHLKLRCFVVIDLKGGEFKPEYAGKMNFYLAAVDDTLKHPTDQPSIGLILCKSKTEVVVEYALRGMTTPMGISEFTHLVTLPDEFKGSLPTIEEIEAELADSLAE